VLALARGAQGPSLSETTTTEQIVKRRFAKEGENHERRGGLDAEVTKGGSELVRLGFNSGCTRTSEVREVIRVRETCGLDTERASKREEGRLRNH